jgi:hypothetical protein
VLLDVAASMGVEEIEPGYASPAKTFKPAAIGRA